MVGLCLPLDRAESGGDARQKIPSDPFLLLRFALDGEGSLVEVRPERRRLLLERHLSQNYGRLAAGVVPLHVTG